MTGPVDVRERVEELLTFPPFAWGQQEREERLLPLLWDLVEWHRARCPAYPGFLDRGGVPNPDEKGFEALPYLPVRLFKEMDLASVPRSEVVKTLTSSGTTGQTPSRIQLDAQATRLQQRALASVITQVIGRQRLPMLILDSRSSLGNRSRMTARGAGAVGLMSFGRDHTWALNPQMDLDHGAVTDFLDRHRGERFLMFGFTYMAWQYFLQALQPGEVDLGQGVLIHSGGWKKLADSAVDPETFRSEWLVRTGLRDMYNFYGMVEQIGTVFLEGTDGWLHCPNFAHVLVRDPLDWRALPPGQPGIIEVMSALPLSYPGHVLLTEDLGVIDTGGGTQWAGPRLRIRGRLPAAELRGCGDTQSDREGKP